MLRRTIAVLASSLVLTGCLDSQASKPPTTLLVSIDTSTETELEFATAFLDEFAFQTGEYQWLVVDVQKEGEVANRYSNTPRRKAVDEVTRTLTQVASNDKALLASLTHAKEYAQKMREGEYLTVVILTEGTSNSDVIQALQVSSQELAQFPRIRLLIAGVDEDNRLPLSQAFTPIEDQVQFFGGGTVELDELLRIL